MRTDLKACLNLLVKYLPTPGQGDIPRKVLRRIPWESSKLFEAKYLNAPNNYF